MTKRASLRTAIDNACKDCIYDPYQEGTWRHQVEKCTSTNCALFSVRPMRVAIPGRGKQRSSILSPEFGLKGPISDHEEGKK